MRHVHFFRILGAARAITPSLLCDLARMGAGYLGRGWCRIEGEDDRAPRQALLDVGIETEGGSDPGDVLAPPTAPRIRPSHGPKKRLAIVPALVEVTSC